MVRLEPVALELLEYKVEAWEKQQPIRGGMPELWALLRVVEQGIGVLAMDERARFSEVSRRLAALADVRAKPSRARADDLASFTLEGVEAKESDLVVDTGAEPPGP